MVTRTKLTTGDDQQRQKVELSKFEFWQCMSDDDKQFLTQLADTKHGMGPCEYVEGWRENYAPD